jgi:arsenate reductase (glutaredoxin)
MKVYTYKNCSTCQNAVKWLRRAAIEFEEIPIRETPPSLDELRAMLAAQKGDLRPLFNTSGQDYRSLGLKDKLPTMTPDAALALLHQNGNLVKRPFLIDTARGIYLTGFREEVWAKALAS